MKPAQNKFIRKIKDFTTTTPCRPSPFQSLGRLTRIKKKNLVDFFTQIVLRTTYHNLK